MTTKLNATKADVTVATEAVIALASEAGAMASGIDSIKDAVSAITRDLHFRAVKIGRFSFKDEAKCCPIARAFVQGRFPFADAVSDSTVSFTLSCFRKAVETGDEYTENPQRKARAAKVKAASEAGEASETEAEASETEAEEAETIICAIKRKSTLIKAASEIRKMAEAMRPIDGLNLLAAMLIDIVDELEGK
jgi:hypothetical protein